MTATRVPALGWGALVLSAAAAAAMPLGAQAAYAAAMVAILGLPHGAADLALVPEGRRTGFLVAYLATVPAIVLLWTVQPAAALALFLGASLVHFASDDRDGRTPVRDWAVAAALIAGPAVVHRADVAILFEAAGAGATAATLAAGLAPIGLAALPVALAATFASRDGATRVVETAALAALLLAPPLVGFAIGFFVLHAREQTIRRQRQLGSADMGAYLRRVAPVLAGAAVVLAGLLAVVPASPAGIRTLFASIAALAMPHMVVTPLWRSGRILGRSPDRARRSEPASAARPRDPEIAVRGC